MDPEKKEELKQKAKGFGKIAWDFAKGAAKITAELGKNVASEIDKSIDQAGEERKKKKELDAVLNQRSGSFLSIHSKVLVLDEIQRRLALYALPRYKWSLQPLPQLDQLNATCTFAEIDSQGKTWQKQVQLQIHFVEDAEGFTRVDFAYVVIDDCPESWVRKESIATNKIIHHANSHIKAAAELGSEGVK